MIVNSLVKFELLWQFQVRFQVWSNIAHDTLFIFWLREGWLCHMNFRNNSKRPSTPPHSFSENCSSQPSMVHWLNSPIFPCWLFGCRAMVTSPLLFAPDPPPNPYIFWQLMIIAIHVLGIRWYWADLIFVKDITDYIHGEISVMWRNFRFL